MSEMESLGGGGARVVKVFIEPLTGRGGPAFFGEDLVVGNTVTFRSDVAAKIDFGEMSPFAENPVCLTANKSKKMEIVNEVQTPDFHIPFQFQPEDGDKPSRERRLAMRPPSASDQSGVVLGFDFASDGTTYFKIGFPAALECIAVEIQNEMPMRVSLKVCLGIEPISISLAPKDKVRIENVTRKLTLSGLKVVGAPPSAEPYQSGGGDIIDIDPSCCFRCDDETGM